MPSLAVLSMFQNILYAYNKMCEPILKRFDIPQVSFDILMFLTNNPQYCTAQEISQVSNIKKNLVSVHVEKLVSAGLLCRGRVNGDRRKVALSCTEKAEPIISAGIEMQNNFHDMLIRGTPEENWKVFLGVIETVDTNAKKVAHIKESEETQA